MAQALLSTLHKLDRLLSNHSIECVSESEVMGAFKLQDCLLIQLQTPYKPFLLSITQSYYSKQIILGSSNY